MNILIFTFGEPIPVDSSISRLRSMGMLAKKALASGHKVDWVAPSFDHITKQYRKNPKNEFIHLEDGYRLFLFDTNSYSKNVSLARIRFFFSCGKKAFQYVKKNTKYDVIICPLEYLPYAKKLVKYCEENKICLIPILLDLWDMAYDAITGFKKLFLLPYKLFMENGHRFALAHTKGFVSLSIPMREWCSKYLKRDINENTDVVFPLAFENAKNTCDDKFLEDNNISGNDFNIVFAGGLNRFVCIDDIFETANNLKDIDEIKFIFCGGGSFFEEYSKMAPNNCVFLGQLSFDKVTSVYSRSDVALLPYKQDSFRFHEPNKFAEYLCFKLPILLKPKGHMENLIISNHCGFQYNNSDELTEIIRDIYKDKSKLNTYKENAFNLYNKAYDADKVFKNFVKYLEEMCIKM